MKISPIAAGSPKTVNVNEGSSVSPEKLARAKQISMGQDPVSADKGTGDLQADRAQASIKKIRMRTNRNTNRHETQIEQPIEATEAKPVDDIPNPIEQVTEASEENKPLSPQFAALMKQKRAFQIERDAFLAEKEAFKTQSGDTKSLEEYRSKLKANALSVLKEEGVTYDQLTEQILADNDGNSELLELRAEIKALKEGVDTRFTEQQTAQEQQVLSEIRREADQLIAKGDDFEMVREAGYAPKVVELIHKTFKQTGEVLDTAEAASLIENELLEESLKFARLKKVQSSLNPAPKSTPVQTDRPNTKVMRTLTNRDGVSSVAMSKRERAIAAMEGRLK